MDPLIERGFPLQLRHKAALFAALNAVLATLVLAYLFAARPKAPEIPWASESNIPSIPRNAEVELLVLGTSHGRELTKDGNHRVVEGILGKPFLNLSKADGAGVLPMELYLDLFHVRGNRARCILYFLDPFVLYSSQWNEKNPFAKNEPFGWDLTWGLVRLRFSSEAIIPYFQYKFTANWLGKLEDGADARDANPDSLSEVDPRAVTWRLANLYPKGLDLDLKKRYVDHLEILAAAAERQGSRFIIALPPTLLGPQPGTDELERDLRAMRERVAFEYVDFNAAIGDASLFYDHDHLNTRGIALFTRDYLKPFLLTRPFP